MNFTQYHFNVCCFLKKKLPSFPSLERVMTLGYLHLIPYPCHKSSMFMRNPLFLLNIIW